MTLSTTPLRVRPTRRLDLCASGALPSLHRIAICRAASGRAGVVGTSSPSTRAISSSSVSCSTSCHQSFSFRQSPHASASATATAAASSFNPTGHVRRDGAYAGSPAPPRSSSSTTSHTIAPPFFPGGTRTFVTTTSATPGVSLRSSSLSSASFGRFQSPSPRQFSSTSPAMVARKLDGTAIAKAIRERLGSEIAERQKLNARYKPCLKIVQGA